MRLLLLILAIIIPGGLIMYLAYYGYNKTHKDSFRDNIISIVHLFKSELESINNGLLDMTLSEEEKAKLIERRDKLIEDLNLFYGERIYN